ncbi:hypothetical protein ACJX0J_039844, partial [Zea mays]
CEKKRRNTHEACILHECLYITQIHSWDFYSNYFINKFHLLSYVPLQACHLIFIACMLRRLSVSWITHYAVEIVMGTSNLWHSLALQQFAPRNQGFVFFFRIVSKISLRSLQLYYGAATF